MQNLPKDTGFIKLIMFGLSEVQISGSVIISHLSGVELNCIVLS